MHRTFPLGSSLHKTLSLSSPITLFSHPETASCKSDLLPLPFIKCNFVPHTFFTENTHPTFLKQSRTDLLLAFCRLVNINTSDNFLKKFQTTSQDGIKHYSLIVQNLQFLCKRKLVFSNECFTILFYLEMTQLFNKLPSLSLAQPQKFRLPKSGETILDRPFLKYNYA